MCLDLNLKSGSLFMLPSPFSGEQRWDFNREEEEWEKDSKYFLKRLNWNWILTAY